MKIDWDIIQFLVGIEKEKSFDYNEEDEKKKD